MEFMGKHGIVKGILSLVIAFLLFQTSCNAAPPDSAPASTTTALPTFTPAPSPIPGGLYVDAGQSFSEISPVFYGTNWGPVFGVPPSVLPIIPTLGLKVVRFPAGNWGDQNDVSESQIDLLMNFCKQWGAEPFFHVRLANSTPEKAAEMVQYIKDKGYKIRFWAIGNEPDLFSRHPVLKLPNYSLEQYTKDWRNFAQAMKAVDPEIQLIGPEISQFVVNPTAEYGQSYTDWLVGFLKANGDLVDIVAVHRYPFPKSTASGAPKKADLRANSAEWDEIIPQLKTLVREHTGRDLPVAVTEFNSSWAENAGGEATVDSHYNGIWFADVMGRMIKQDTYMLQQFAVTGRLGMMGRFEPYGTGYAYQMYARFGSRRVYTSTDQEYVTVYAARRADGALTIMVVNLNSEPRAVNLRLDNFPLGEAETWLFDLEHKAELTAPTALQANTRLNLTSESVTLFILPGK